MKTKAKPSYKVRNWRQYNAAFKQRGSLTFWSDKMVVERWINEQKTGRRGASIGVNEATGEVLAAVASTNNLSDDEALSDLLDGIDEETLASVWGWSV